MSKQDNGGPAFPFVEPDTSCNVNEGMTLRDYFAAKADISKDIDDDGCITPRLAFSLMECASPPSWDDNYFEARLWWAEAEARLRYLKADAMLKARQS